MKRRWFTVVGALFTLGSLYLAFRGIQPREVLHILRDVEVVWAVPVVLATLLSIWIRAYRWKVLLQPVREVTVGATYSATMIGFMANNILPMRLGELVRAYALGRSGGVSKSSAFATIVVERAFDLLAILLFLGAMLLRYSFAHWVAVAGYVALGTCVGMFAVMALMWWQRARTQRLLSPLFHRLPGGMGAEMEGWFVRFLDGLGILSRGHHVLWVTVLSVLTWLAMAGGFYYTGTALGLDLPVEASLVLLVICSLAVMLPSGPGFVGTFEAGARYGLLLFPGITSNEALSYALFYHAATFVSVTLLGFYHLWRTGFSLRRAVEEEAAPG